MGPLKFLSFKSSSKLDMPGSDGKGKFGGRPSLREDGWGW